MSYAIVNMFSFFWNDTQLIDHIHPCFSLDCNINVSWFVSELIESAGTELHGSLN